MQQRFVVARFERPDASLTQCIRMAGYRGSQDAVKKAASRWAQNEKVKAALREYAATTIHLQLPQAVGAISDIITDPRNRDRLKASLAVLDRTGLHAVTESHQTVTHTFDRLAMIGRLAALLEKYRNALPTPTGSRIESAPRHLPALDSIRLPH